MPVIVLPTLIEEVVKTARREAKEALITIPPLGLNTEVRVADLLVILPTKRTPWFITLVGVDELRAAAVPVKLIRNVLFAVAKVVARLDATVALT